jgi:predicted nucleotidyltransferase
LDKVDLSNINEDVKTKVEPFFNEILSAHEGIIASIYLVGSALTKDFNPALSDINSLIVLKESKPEFFDFLALRGKRFGKKKIRAPQVITRSYVENSLDVFPIEFLDMQLINKLVYGDDILKDLKFEKTHLRLQCERELKGSLQTVRQGYIKALDDKHVLKDFFLGLLSGSIPVFRAILYLHDKELPRDKLGVLNGLEQTAELNTQLFRELYKIKTKNLKPALPELQKIFSELLDFFEKASKKINEFIT